MTADEQLFVGFPQSASDWIPNLEQVRTSANIILQVAGQALDYFPVAGGQNKRGEVYKRRVLSTGRVVPIVPNQDGQLSVSVFNFYIGRAGEQRFQFFKGDLGSYSQRVMVFLVRLARLSPTITGGIAPKIQKESALDEQSNELWVDAYIVWSALLAMALGGVTNAQTGKQLSPAPITQDNLLIGPCAFPEPNGGVASAEIEIAVQL